MRLQRLTLVLVALSLAVAITALARQLTVRPQLVAELCRQQEDRCRFDCDTKHREAAGRLMNESNAEFTRFTEALWSCISFDAVAAQQCRQAEVEKHNEILRGIEARRSDAERNYMLCVPICAAKGAACRGEDPRDALQKDPPLRGVE